MSAATSTGISPQCRCHGGSGDFVLTNWPAPTPASVPSGSYPRYGTTVNVNSTTGKRYSVLTCPSDEPNAPIGQITSHNYVVNHGNTHIGQGTFQGVTFKGAPFVSRAATKLLDIADGLSNTLLMAEVRQGQRRDLRGFSWWGPSASFTTFFPPNTTSPDANQYGPGESNGYCDPLPPNPPCIINSSAYPTIQSARSQHSQGVNVVLGDGSVRFVSNNINLQTWRNLGSTRDGEALGDF